MMMTHHRLSWRTKRDRIVYSFPIQLLVMHVKKNQLLLIYWAILFAFVTRSVANRFGIPYLFLDPEYMGTVGPWSFLITGLATGMFIMAFNISSYILNSFRFPFLATLSKTFQKYTVNNFILPIGFLLVYITGIIEFQYFSQLKGIGEIALSIVSFLTGVVTIVLLTLRYFLLTNKDIYKLYGVEHSENAPQPMPVAEPDKKKSRKKKPGKKPWRVDTYIALPVHIRLVRPTAHYKEYMLMSVFKQNHINAAVVELIIFTLFIVLGLFREYQSFQIPAAASLLLLFTMFIMLSGVLRFWLRSWATSALIGVFLLFNFMSQFEVFNQKNKLVGLDYTGPRKTYDLASLSKAANPGKIESDKAQTTAILERWKNGYAGEGKPKFIVINVSGGGSRSSLFTFRTLQAIDSIVGGTLMQQARLITGSSGGMVGAAYYRSLYLDQKQELSAAINDPHNAFLTNMGKDMLNATAFSFMVSDLFLNLQSFTEGGNVYYKDRGYAWEQQLNRNTGDVFNRNLEYFRKPELEAQIPMMIFTPTMINDGRSLLISPVGVSYLLQGQDTAMLPICDGIEYTGFFNDHNAMNTRYTSVLRVNATFPWIMPSVNLPTEPITEAMDAGLRDNFGLLHSVRFLHTFKEWIRENTSGVLVIQIRDTNKEFKLQNKSESTILEKMTSPIRNFTGNFILMQDYYFDDYLTYMRSWLGTDLDYVRFELPNMEERIPLSWHLTEKEKVFLKDVIHNEDNTRALKKVKALIK
jgi:hypothetical protein